MGGSGNLGRHLLQTHDIATGSRESPTSDKRFRLHPRSQLPLRMSIQAVHSHPPSRHQTVNSTRASIHESPNQTINQSTCPLLNQSPSISNYINQPLTISHTVYWPGCKAGCASASANKSDTALPSIP